MGRFFEYTDRALCRACGNAGRFRVEHCWAVLRSLNRFLLHTHAASTIHLPPSYGELLIPRVSIIIATYNRAHLLGAAVDSVLAQTFSDYELIIADDGSSDATSDLITSYLQSGESKTDCIRYFRQPNQGKSVALNNAMLQAKGEWIAFLDSDDRWLPEKLERQFRAIEQFGDRRGACFTDGQFVNNQHMDTTAFEFFGQHYEESVGTLPDAVKTLATTPAGISIVTLVCRADLVRKVGGFDPAIRFTESYDFFFFQ